METDYENASRASNEWPRQRQRQSAIETETKKADLEDQQKEFSNREIDWTPLIV